MRSVLPVGIRSLLLVAATTAGILAIRSLASHRDGLGLYWFVLLLLSLYATTWGLSADSE